MRYALARGHKITLFNRGKRPQDWPAEVEELVGDRSTGDVAALKGRKWDVCIDNPTSVPFWVRDVGEVLADNVDHYIFISTISVYADNGKPGMDESGKLAEYTGADIMKETRDTLMANMELYGPMKAGSEAQAQQYFKDKTTIIRPGLIVGPGDETDRFSYWPLRIERGGEVLAPSANGSDPVQFIDARDLAEWTIRMAEARAFGIYNATGPDYEMSVAGMLYGIRAVTTQGAQFTFVPADFLEAQKVAPWGDMPVWVPTRRIRRLLAHQHRQGGRGGAHFQAAGDHRRRHADLVPRATGRTAGNDQVRHQTRARARGPGRLGREKVVAGRRTAPACRPIRRRSGVRRGGCRREAVRRYALQDAESASSNRMVERPGSDREGHRIEDVEVAPSHRMRSAMRLTAAQAGCSCRALSGMLSARGAGWRGASRGLRSLIVEEPETAPSSVASSTMAGAGCRRGLPAASCARARARPRRRWYAPSLRVCRSRVLWGSVVASCRALRRGSGRIPEGASFYFLWGHCSIL